jgi:hypothetical protein
MFGKTWRVVGLLDAEAFNRMVDLDNEKLTPVDIVTEAASMNRGAEQDPRLLATAPIQSFTHLESSTTIILPYEDLLEIGGTLRSVAIVPRAEQERNSEEAREREGEFSPIRPFAHSGEGAGGAEGEGFLEVVKAFVSRVTIPIFVGLGDRVTVYSSIGATSISGLRQLLIPILIAALIVFNTMMGSVYERFREIGIYSSVGLAPVHIAALFLAEAAVFATIGAVVGYLIGQVGALVLAPWGLLHGMSINYSSLSAVSSTLIVMITVFLSTIYPAKKASDLAVPDVTRRWRFPDPVGDDWAFDFPFTVGGGEIRGLYAYLAEVFETYKEGSIGEFLTEDVRLSMDPDPHDSGYTISMKVWLAPYDLGIAQQVMLKAIPTGEHAIYRIVMMIHRLSGDVDSWRRINRGFLNILRKRFLVWRTIPGHVKDRYHQAAKEIVV